MGKCSPVRGRQGGEEREREHEKNREGTAKGKEGKGGGREGRKREDI